MSASDEEAGQRLNRLGRHGQDKDLDSFSRKNSTSHWVYCGVARAPREKKNCCVIIVVTGAVIVGLLVAVAFLAIGDKSKANTDVARSSNHGASFPKLSPKHDTSSPELSPKHDTSSPELSPKHDTSSPELSPNHGASSPVQPSNCSSIPKPSSNRGASFPKLSPHFQVASSPERPTNCSSSPECNFQASQLMLSINPSVDPCHDFYKFACGRKIDNMITSSVVDQPLVQQQLLVFKRMRGLLTQTYEPSDPMWKPTQVFAACLESDKNTVKTMKSVITELGGWPLADGVTRYALNRPTKIQPFFEKLKTYAREGALFSVSVSPKKTDTSRLLVAIGPPMPDLSPLELIDIIRLTKIINPQNSLLEALRGIKEMMLLQTRINKAILLIDITDTDDVQKEVTIAHLTNSIFRNKVNWLDLLNSVFRGIKYFKSTDKVLVTLPAYFEDIMSYISIGFDETTEKSIVNLEILHLLKMMIGNVNVAGSSKTLKKSYAQQLTTSNLQTLLTSRWASCVDTVSDWFGYSIAPEYAKYYPDAEAGFESVKNMTKYVLDAFKDRLSKLSWLDEATRRAILKKITSIKQNYRYPQWANDEANVNKYYETFVVGDGHLDNYVAFSKFTTRNNYLQITDRGLQFPTWEMSPLTANAYYNPRKNSITILEAIMQPPTFSMDRLNVMNYGTLGMVLAHEISHALDAVGSRYDGEGNLNAIWENDNTKDKAETRFQCFVNQYSQYQLTTDDLPGFNGTLKTLSGRLEINENVADNGGIRNAYWAYKKWEQDHGPEDIPDVSRQYTHDQLFFISFANPKNQSETRLLRMRGALWITRAIRNSNRLEKPDDVGLSLRTSLHSSVNGVLLITYKTPEWEVFHASLYQLEWCTAYRFGLSDLRDILDVHSPARFRVIGSLSNLEEFGKAFNCPANSRMTPKERCELW